MNRRERADLDRYITGTRDMEHSLTDDTSEPLGRDIDNAIGLLDPVQSEARVPLECRRRIADATRLLRGALRKLPREKGE